MLVILEKKDFKTEFAYYNDYLGGRDSEIIDIKFYDCGLEVDVDSIELAFGNKEDKEEDVK